VQEAAEFKVHMDGGDEDLDVQISDSNGRAVPCELTQEINMDYSCKYYPKTVGVHTVTIQCDGRHIRNSPYHVPVGDTCRSTIRVFGPGLSEGVANQPAVFTISGNSDSLTQVNVSIDGPSRAAISTEAQPDGTVDVSYVPSCVGEYVVHVDDRNEDVIGSPFIVQVLSESPTHSELCADDVVVSGPGVSLNSVVRKKRAPFTVDASKCRVDTEPVVSCYDAVSGASTAINLRRGKQPRMHKCSYLVKNAAAVVVYVKYCGKNAPGSPFHVNVCPNSAHKVSLLFIPNLSVVLCVAIYNLVYVLSTIFKEN
jgi:filamin